MKSGSLKVTATGWEGEYDGDPHYITVKAPDGATVMYSEDPDGPFCLSELWHTEAGTYIIYYQVTKPNYATKTGHATLIIHPASIAYTGGVITLELGEAKLVKNMLLLIGGSAQGGSPTSGFHPYTVKTTTQDIDLAEITGLNMDLGDDATVLVKNEF